MNISKITISNILGIEELEFDAGQFNPITGANGSGKTSVLEAIKSVFQRGHDATLLRNGATSGEVVLVLDEGTEIVRRVGVSKSDTIVRRDGKQQARPAEIIRDLADLMSINPVEFLRASKKDRVRVLLESLPLVADVARIREIVGDEKIEIADGVHALLAIESVSAKVYDARTGTNRAIKEKEATINQLRSALPAEMVGGIANDEEALVAQMEEANKQLQAERDRISSKLDGIKSEHEKAMDELRAQMETARAALQETIRKAGMQTDKVVAAHATAVGPIREALAVVRNDRDAAAKRQQSLKIIDQFDGEAQDLRDEADALTFAIDGLAAYKLEMLSSLPIKGLEIRDEELFRDGVHFDRLNTAQQVAVAVDIAKLRSGKLGVICVDGLELMDTEHFDLFRDAAVNSGLQLFVTRVTDGEMSIDAGDGF